MGAAGIETYLSHLAVERKFAFGKSDVSIVNALQQAVNHAGDLVEVFAHVFVRFCFDEASSDGEFEKWDAFLG